MTNSLDGKSSVMDYWNILFNPLRPSEAHMCLRNLTIIGSDYGLSPGRRQAIIWTYMLEYS